jgi:TPR repeat protein
MRRDALQSAATKGDPAAQYKLGDTWCCQGGGPLDNVTIYDNHKATEWYCRAARQGYAPAQLRLAQIYSGHPIHGMHVALRASALVGASGTDQGVALMWASVAARHGDDDAVELRDSIRAKATDKELARGATLLGDWKTAPCRWSEVFNTASHAK